MSALLPKADIGTQPRIVWFVPKADIGLMLLDQATQHHFVPSNAFSASCKISRICEALVESIMLALK